jgi:hypothetical protein
MSTITPEQQMRIVTMEIISQIADLSNKLSKFTATDIDQMLGIKKKNAKMAKQLESIFTLGEEISKLSIICSDSKKEAVVTPSTASNAENNEADPVQLQTTIESPIVKQEGSSTAEQPKVKEDKKSKEEKPKENKKSKEEKPKEDKPKEDKPKEDKPKEDKPKEENKPKEDKPKQETTTEPKGKAKKEKVTETPKAVDTPKVTETPKPTENTEEISSEDEGSSKMDDKQPLYMRRKNIPKHIKTLVWNKYIGRETVESKCVSCKQEKIDMRNFHCGHVLAEAKGGDLTINNLRPICAPCNLSMGTKSMNEFTQEFFGWSV